MTYLVFLLLFAAAFATGDGLSINNIGSARCVPWHELAQHWEYSTDRVMWQKCEVIES